jgi:hypothetical protein
MKYMTYRGEIAELTDADVAAATQMLDERYRSQGTSLVLVDDGSVEVELFRIPVKEVADAVSPIYWHGISSQGISIDPRELSGSVDDLKLLSISVRHAVQQVIRDLDENQGKYQGRINTAAIILRETGFQFGVEHVQLNSNQHYLHKDHVSSADLKAGRLALQAAAVDALSRVKRYRQEHLDATRAELRTRPETWLATCSIRLDEDVQPLETTVTLHVRNAEMDVDVVFTSTDARDTRLEVYLTTHATSHPLTLDTIREILKVSNTL